MTLPIIDISGFDSPDPARRQQVATEWGKALETLGFVLISGHGISGSLCTKLHKAATAFFDQPVDQKDVWASHDGKPVGYVRLFAESVGKTYGQNEWPDISESLSFNMSTADCTPEGNWPDTEPELLNLINDYSKNVYDLGRRLMHMSALALKLPETYFDRYFDPMPQRLRLAFYPDQVVPPKPGQIRNAAHTDFGGFTILLQDDAPGGLQVLTPEGDWVDVPSVPGTLVINTGDIIQRWTNDRWLSNVHRVVNPPLTHQGSTKRLSIVMFTSPKMDTEIACLPTCHSDDRQAEYAPITAAEIIRTKMLQTYDLGKDVELT